MRACPLCGADESHSIIRLNAQEIIKANWSYRKSAIADWGVDLTDEFPIEKCSKCDFVYAGRMPKPKFLDYVYDQLIDIEVARRESYSPQNIAARMDYMRTFLGLLGDGGKVLDYGCGFGPSLALLRNIPGISVFGFETSAARVREISIWHSTVTLDLNCVREHGPFDAIILDNVLEHVPNPRETVQSIATLCLPGTLLYVSVPDAGKRYLDAQIALNRESKLLAMDINPWEHLSYFDLPHLDELMASAGFIALRAAQLPSEVRIGLRPLGNIIPRLKNTLACMVRQMNYVLTGDALPSVNRRFYRYTSHVTI